MTDTKPVLTPRVGQFVIVEGFGLRGDSDEGKWFDSEQVEVVFVGAVVHNAIVLDKDGNKWWVGLRSVVAILPAQEEKPKAEPPSDEEIRNYQLLSSPLSPRQTVALFDRIEADREKLKAKDLILYARNSRIDELQAQNAEQAQKIARLCVLNAEFDKTLIRKCADGHTPICFSDAVVCPVCAALKGLEELSEKLGVDGDTFGL